MMVRGNSFRYGRLSPHHLKRDALLQAVREHQREKRAGPRASLGILFPIGMSRDERKRPVADRGPPLISHLLVVMIDNLSDPESSRKSRRKRKRVRARGAHPATFGHRYTKGRAKNGDGRVIVRRA